MLCCFSETRLSTDQCCDGCLRETAGRKEGRFRASGLAARTRTSWDMVFDTDACVEALPVGFSALPTHIRYASVVV